MPTAAMKKWAPAFAKKNKITVKTALSRLEKLWETAKKAAKKQTGDEENWQYVMTVFKRMTGLFPKKKSTSSQYSELLDKLDQEFVEIPSSISSADEFLKWIHEQ